MIKPSQYILLRIKYLVEDWWLFNIYKQFIINKELTNYQAGGLTSPPYAYKRKIIQSYAKKNKIVAFVETGTFLGDTIKDLLSVFTKMYSIELDQDLYKLARLRFKKYPYVTLIQGNSGLMLGKIIKKLDKPCLFWLDGHYSGGVTGKADKNTPIIEELTAILNHKIKKHIILIDDARCFTGENDYPSIDYLKQFVIKKNKNLSFLVKDDIIRICYR